MYNLWNLMSGKTDSSLMKTISSDVARLIVLSGSKEIRREIKYLKNKVQKLETEKASRKEMKEWTTNYK